MDGICLTDVYDGIQDCWRYQLRHTHSSVRLLPRITDTDSSLTELAAHKTEKLSLSGMFKLASVLAIGWILRHGWG